MFRLAKFIQNCSCMSYSHYDRYVTIKPKLCYLQDSLTNFYFIKLMAHEAHYFSEGCLFVQSSLWIFLTERFDAVDKILFFIISFYWTVNKKYWVCAFSQNCFDCKKRPVKVASTMFLSREVEQLKVYQLLPNFAIWGDFEWLPSGSEPVIM